MGAGVSPWRELRSSRKSRICNCKLTSERISLRVILVFQYEVDVNSSSILSEVPDSLNFEVVVPLFAWRH